MIKFSREVTEARLANRPIVALESTIISHGLPRPKNLDTAREVEAIVRDGGATPATIAIIKGEVYVGLESSQLEELAGSDQFVKASIRDLPALVTSRASAATTVAATSHIAALAGIQYFATGGLGGVHRGASQSWDESADLMALANNPVLVVCAGAKSILDIPATLERLETLSVLLIGYRTNKFPGFYLSDSGYTLEHRAESPEEIARIWAARHGLGMSGRGAVVANPVEHEMDSGLHARLLADGLAAADEKGIHGKEVTPFLLDYFHSNSDGESLRVNIEIIRANAALAAEIARAAN